MILCLLIQNQMIGDLTKLFIRIRREMSGQADYVKANSLIFVTFIAMLSIRGQNEKC